MAGLPLLSDKLDRFFNLLVSSVLMLVQHQISLVNLVIECLS